jgi:hypothetical protein
MKTIFALLALLCLAIPVRAADITDLTPLGAAPDPTNDLMYIWDQSVGAGGANGGMKSMTPANLADYIDGATMTFTNKSLSIGQVTGLGTDVAAFLATPSSANLATAVTNETGSGLLVFGTAPTFATTITVGAASGTTGSILFKGTTSGTITMKSADAAGTYTLTLPTTDGDADQVLKTDGSGVLSWVASSSGAVATDSIFDALGDLAVGTGANTAAKLTVGSDDTVLVADSGEATGLKWTASPVFTSVTATTGNITTFRILDNVDQSHGMQIVVASDLAANRTLTITTGDANRAITLTGDLIRVGAHSLTLTTAGATDVTLPTSGTLAILAGDVWTGVHDFGGATSLEVPNSDDVDVDAAGEVSWDTDGWLRAYDGTNQVAVGRKIEALHCTVVLPNDLADSERDAFWMWSNESGMSFVVTGWKVWSDTDDTTLNIEEIDADGANNATVDAVEAATNGTGVFTGADTTITAATIENGHLLVLDFDDTDTPGQVKIVVYGYYNADVN